MLKRVNCDAHGLIGACARKECIEEGLDLFGVLFRGCVELAYVGQFRHC
jgi:hypothetical protein